MNKHPKENWCKSFCNHSFLLELTHFFPNSQIFNQTQSIILRSYSSDLSLCLPLEWTGVCCSLLVQVLCVTEQRRVKEPVCASWGNWRERVSDRTKSLKVGSVINGIDQPVNATVYILLCLCSLSTTVLNWACSKQPPQGALWKLASHPPLIDMSISWEAVDSAFV